MHERHFVFLSFCLAWEAVAALPRAVRHGYTALHSRSVVLMGRIPPFISSFLFWFGTVRGATGRCICRGGVGAAAGIHPSSASSVMFCIFPVTYRLAFLPGSASYADHDCSGFSGSSFRMERGAGTFGVSTTHLQTCTSILLEAYACMWACEDIILVSRLFIQRHYDSMAISRGQCDLVASLP